MNINIEPTVTTAKINESRIIADIPWVEKYRPKELSDIVGNPDIIERFQKMIDTNNLPNIIISGTSGIGKTASILCIAKKLLGDQFNNAVLELNSSDDRGIKTVREQIKTFVNKKVSLPSDTQKIIILDEADSMTSEAQKALLSIIEMNSQQTRFAFLCNTSSNIIEPIQSRCIILRFRPLKAIDIKNRLIEIANKENIVWDDAGLDILVSNSNNDMRIAINNLQACYYGYSVVNTENISKVVDIPHPEVIKEMIKETLKNNFIGAYHKISFLYQKGYDNADIVNTILHIIKDYDLPDNIKIEYLKIIGQYYIRLTEAIDSQLQMDGLVAALSMVNMGDNAEPMDNLINSEFTFKLV
jgi:replication factor C subunit 2/4